MSDTRQNLLTRLPPLNAVRAFHAASRHLNFSRAAEELGVTQGAISKQIIALEDHVGTQLFERLSTGLILTNEGKSLKETIIPAFDMLGSAFSRFERRAPRASNFRIATVASFASNVLVTRLDAFRDAFPQLELEIIASDRLVELEREEIDISIRYGRGDWPGLVVSPLSNFILVPVCLPSLLTAGTVEDDPELLARHRRVQIFSGNEWKAWQALSQVPMPPGTNSFIMEDFTVALNAALTGQGLCFLPEILVRDYLARGTLTTFSRNHVTWDRAFHIACLPQAAKKPKIQQVITWLTEEFAAAAM